MTTFYDLNPNNYASIGHMKSKKKGEHDMTQCCLPGGFMNCQNGDYPYSLLNCPDFMADRCAKSWDQECTIYAEGLTIKEDRNRFLSKVADKRYCKVDPNNFTLLTEDKNVSPGIFYGQEFCQLSNPQDPDSPEICEWKGPQTYYKDTGTCALGPTYFQPADENRICKKPPKGDYAEEICMLEDTCDKVIMSTMLRPRVAKSERGNW